MSNRCFRLSDVFLSSALSSGERKNVVASIGGKIDVYHNSYTSAMHACI